MPGQQMYFIKRLFEIVMNPNFNLSEINVFKIICKQLRYFILPTKKHRTEQKMPKNGFFFPTANKKPISLSNYDPFH